MRKVVRRVYNLAPFVGQFNTYEVTEELEFEEGVNPKLVLAYLNNLIEETYYNYILTCVDIKPEWVDEAVAKWKKHTKERIRYYNKIYKQEI